MIYFFTLFLIAFSFSEETAKILFQPKTNRDPLLAPSERTSKKVVSVSKPESKREEPSADGLPAPLMIQGVTRIGESPAVIIEDEVRRIGEEVFGVKILAITNQFIVFKYQGRIVKRFLAETRPTPGRRKP